MGKFAKLIANTFPPMLLRGVIHVVLIGVTLFIRMEAVAEDDWQNVERVVAVGDIHGDYAGYIQVLTDAGIINRRGNWVAGNTHLVQLGDLPDRGPDTKRIIEHMQKLESQALRDGGRVHALIGNHEMMNMAGDLRYVHPGEYEALKSSRASSLREAFYDQVVDYLSAQEPPVVIDEAFRQQWELEFPLGYVEHRNFWSPQGEFGSWVLEHNAVIRINDTLFLHGGLSPVFVGTPIRAINDRIRAELADPGLTGVRISEAQDGPLWYRGLASNIEAEEKAHVESVLDSFGVKRVVIGHTPGYGTVIPRFEGRVLVIDTGISSYYGGHLGSLLLEGGQAKTIQRGETVVIPDNGNDLIAYYEKILTLESGAENLKTLLASLKDPSIVQGGSPSDETDIEISPHPGSTAQ